VTIERCEQCPLDELDKVRAQTAVGRLLDRVNDLDFETTRFRVSLEEVPADEFIGLRVLEQERVKRLQEDRAEQEEEWRRNRGQ
jgi:hypothetical protein